MTEQDSEESSDQFWLAVFGVLVWILVGLGFYGVFKDM